MDSLSYRKTRSAQPEPEQPEATPPMNLAFEAPQEVHSAPQRRESSAKHSRHERSRFPGGLAKWIIGAAIVVAGLLAYMWLGGSSLPGVETNKYQAVFLVNGQVYFGKLQAMDAGHVKMTNIFYLQRKATGDNKQNPQDATAQSANDVELVKLGNEIHGPEDTMIIAREQILFYENLKDNGNVAKTIGQYKPQTK